MKTFKMMPGNGFSHTRFFKVVSLNIGKQSPRFFRLAILVLLMLLPVYKSITIILYCRSTAVYHRIHLASKSVNAFIKKLRATAEV